MDEPIYDRVSVRRIILFIRKQIHSILQPLSLLAAYDDELKQRFLNAISPVLTTIKDRRGIADFNVSCEIINSDKVEIRVGILPMKGLEFIFIETMVSGEYRPDADEW